MLYRLRGDQGQAPGGFLRRFCDEAKTSAIIAQVWKKHHYLIDPHTAVAYG